MVSAYSTFANGGVHTDPIFVTRIEDRQGNLIATFIPESQDAVSERTAYTMLTMLQSVVTNGTAGRLKWQFDLGDAQLGGKTGTSEKIDTYDENGKPVEDKIVSFIGVAPIDDPKYVVLVALDTPNYVAGTSYCLLYTSDAADE